MMNDDNYPEGPPPSQHGKIPRWIVWCYVLLPIWGIVTLFLYWNGSGGGWFDRGYWGQLQKAANTTYPYINHNINENNK